MAEIKENEKIFTIPLRKAYKKAKEQRTPYAARLVRDFLKNHTKATTVKLGPKLNQTLWARGIKKPPRKIRVKAVRDGDIVKAELVGFEYQEFKAKAKKERKGVRERLMERLGPKALKKEEEEKKIEGKEEKEAKKESKTEEKKEAKTEAKTEEKK